MGAISSNPIDDFTALMRIPILGLLGVFTVRQDLSHMFLWQIPKLGITHLIDRPIKLLDIHFRKERGFVCADGLIVAELLIMSDKEVSERSEDYVGANDRASRSNRYLLLR